MHLNSKQRTALLARIMNSGFVKDFASVNNWLKFLDDDSVLMFRYCAQHTADEHDVLVLERWLPHATRFDKRMCIEVYNIDSMYDELKKVLSELANYTVALSPC